MNHLFVGNKSTFITLKKHNLGKYLIRIQNLQEKTVFYGGEMRSIKKFRTLGQNSAIRLLNCFQMQTTTGSSLNTNMFVRGSL